MSNVKKILFGFFVIAIFFVGGFSTPLENFNFLTGFNSPVFADEEPECECADKSDPCCDGCHFLSKGTECYSQTEYRCLPEKKCGGNIQEREITRSCNGENAECPDEEDVGEWKTKKECCHLAKCDGPKEFTERESDYKCQLDKKCPPELDPPENREGVELPLIEKFAWEDLTDFEEINAQCGTDLTEPYVNAYYFQAFREDTGKINFEQRISKKEDILPHKLDFENDPDISVIETEWGYFTKDTTYLWHVAPCSDDYCKEEYRGEFSPPYKFTTFSGITLETPEPLRPKDPVVNFSNELLWTGVSRADFYQYQIKEEGKSWDNAIVDNDTSNSSVSFSQLWDYLEFDTDYVWRVRSCWAGKHWWGGSKTICEDEWSSDVYDEWKFTTTGATPTGVLPTNGTTTTIPVFLNWDDMDAALSYRCEIATDETSFVDTIVADTTTKKSEVEIDYPDIKMETDYYWRISTCADENGEKQNCGAPTAPQKITTLKLPTPSNPSPKDDGKDYFSRSFPISWEKISWAKSYQYHLDYIEVSDEEANEEECSKLLGPIIDEKTVTRNSASLPLQCLGDYQWSARACLSDKGQECGDWKEPLWTFTLTQYVPQTKEKGFVPCGKNYDNLETPYNERESCGIQHIFLMLQIILDFVLWRLGIIILAALSIIIGVMSYFSLGNASTAEQIKSLLKAAAVGWCIILLAWMFINYLLSIFGLNITIFGRWWILPY